MDPRMTLGNERGTALIVALGVLSIMVIIGVMVSVLSMNSSNMVAHDIGATETQNLAEAGIDEVIAITTANYSDIYPGGYIPDSSYPGDGMSFYVGPQDVTDAQGAATGSFEAWTKADPDRPGNVLITAVGTKGEASTKVRVSVRYMPRIFDFALLVGDPDQSYPAGDCAPSLSMNATKNSIVKLTGNIHVNGCLNTDKNDNGIISLNSRDGYNDAVTYTDSYSGTAPDGMQPYSYDEIKFPTIDFNALPNKVTVNIGNNNYNINANTFEALYGSYDVVEFVADAGAKKTVTINGSGDEDNPWVITTTILIPGRPAGDKPDIETFQLKGPGLSLQPKNLLALITGEGRVEVWKGTTIGSPGAGALVYVTGQNKPSEFMMDKGALLYGSAVVSSIGVDMQAIGNTDSGNSRDKTVEIMYDPAFLASLPAGFWSGGSMMAVKENYEIDNS